MNQLVSRNLSNTTDCFMNLSYSKFVFLQTSICDWFSKLVLLAIVVGFLGIQILSKDEGAQ